MCGRDHPLGHALPGEVRRPPARPAPPWRVRARRVEREPGHQLGGDLLDRARGRRWNDSSGRSALGQRRGQRGRDLGHARSAPADSGSAPQAAASAATMPNASGNVLGITCASQAGSRLGRSSCSRRPVKWIRSAARGGGAQATSLVHAAVEEGAQVAQLAGRAALELAAAGGDLAQVLEVGAPPAPPRSGPAPRGRCRSRPPRGRARAPRPPRSGQAASSRSTPLETISLPT